jgi:hypothetical protein
MRLREPF